MGNTIHELLSAPATTLICVALIILCLGGMAPRLVAAWKQLKGAPSVGAQTLPLDIPGTWIEKMRAEARHSASNMVQPVMLKVGMLEHRIEKVAEMVEEVRPVLVEVAKLTTSVEFLRENVEKLERTVTGGMKDLHESLERHLAAKEARS